MTSSTRLFHFSDDDSIERFEPRPVRVPAPRPPGMAWLNGPLVWAIDDWHQPMYLFPRECPRILIWRTEHSSNEDAGRWLGASRARIVAFVERERLAEMASTRLHRYELPTQPFVSLNDAGMWVARTIVAPIARVEISDLAARLADSDVELRPVDDLAALRAAWDSSLHVSGIRLRNAPTWTRG